MSKIAELLLYICQQSPRPDDLSKARVTKMMYLADWKSAIERERQLTSIRWRFDLYGPWVDDVIQIARSDDRFTVSWETTLVGNDKEVIGLNPAAASLKPKLTKDERAILDFIIQATTLLSWNEFIKLVYATYPIMSEPRFAYLDLVSLANDYQVQQEEIGWNNAAPLLSAS